MKKFLIIGVLVLFIGASVIPAVSADLEQNPQTTDILWEDNFDSYGTGDSLHGVGGWEGWENDPQWTAYTTDVQARSSPNSVDIVADADLVQPFVGVNSGLVVMTTYQYIPTGFTGESYFILLNRYEYGAESWSTQLRCSSNDGYISSEFEEEFLPLIYDQWVELRVEIDFDTDWQEIYYNDELLSEKSWTDGVSGGGDLNLGGMDLFANGATSVYYDDFTLDGEGIEPTPDLDCDGTLEWDEVPTGETVTGSFEVSNVGTPASMLDWEVSDYPDWGTWTFDPESGEDLTPEDSPITVDVEVVAPADKNTEFTGRITLVNVEDPEDTCTIDVTLITPYNYNLVQVFLQRLANRFPFFERFL